MKSDVNVSDGIIISLVHQIFMASNTKPQQVFTIVRNYRKIEERRKKRKISFNSKSLKSVKKIRKLT
jgi:hypothetical protein